MVIVPKLGMITIVEIEAELMNNFKLGELSKSKFDSFVYYFISSGTRLL